MSVPQRRRQSAEGLYRGVGASIIAERIEYLDENGKLVTEACATSPRKRCKKHFASLDDFLKRWKETERKQAIVEELGDRGTAA